MAQRSKVMSAVGTCQRRFAPAACPYGMSTSACQRPCRRHGRHPPACPYGVSTSGMSMAGMSGTRRHVHSMSTWHGRLACRRTRVSASERKNGEIREGGSRGRHTVSRGVPATKTRGDRRDRQAGNGARRPTIAEYATACRLVPGALDSHRHASTAYCTMQYGVAIT